MTRSREPYIKPPLPRFFTRLQQMPNGCIEWTGPVKENGYATFSVNGKLVYVHRFSYETFVGPIPEGKQIDHLCRNRRCVRPSHLEAVTQRVNLARGDSPSAKAHRENICQRGHALDDAYVTPNGRRQCQRCRSDRRRAHYEKSRA